MGEGLHYWAVLPFVFILLAFVSCLQYKILMWFH